MRQGEKYEFQKMKPASISLCVKHVEAFEKIYRELSIEQDIPLVEFMLENIALNKDLMQLDGIHPNQKAQSLIASEVQKSLAKIIENP